MVWVGDGSEVAKVVGRRMDSKRVVSGVLAGYASCCLRSAASDMRCLLFFAPLFAAACRA